MSTTFYYSTGGGGKTTTQPAKQSVAESAPAAVHDEQYTLRDHTGSVLANVHYRIVADTGQEFTGTTNAVGQTERIVTDAAASLRIYAKEN
ncbi:hypothetical protein [Burkholderia stagnalis]